MNSGLGKHPERNWLLRFPARTKPVLKVGAIKLSKPPLWVLGMIIAVICLPPFHLLTHSWPENRYGGDLIGVAKNTIYWLISPTKLLRLSALGLAVLLPLISLKLSNFKLRLLALGLSVFVPLSLAQMADVVRERNAWLLFPLQGDLDRNIDNGACLDAYERFGLGQYNLPKGIIAAELHQEQGAIGFQDLVEDKCVSYFGETPFGMDLSIGPAQMQKSNVIRLAREFPKELKDFWQEPAKSGGSVNLRAALERKNSAMLVAAYYKSVINRLEQDKPACPDQSKLKNERIARIWKAGTPQHELYALAMSYCPARVDHPGRVLYQLRLLDNAEKQNATQEGKKGQSIDE